MNEGFGIPKNIQALLIGVFARHASIEEVRIYGSRARGAAAIGSDIDLVVFAPSMSEREFAALWDEIDALPIALAVDLVHWDSLRDPALRQVIEQESKPFYRPARAR